MKKFKTTYHYSTEYIACHIADNVVELLNDGDYNDLDTAISEEIDRYLIYSKEQWEVMMAYQTPNEANLAEAVQLLIEDVYNSIAEDDEDDEEE